ncbi:phytanoyl-CoA dioxygenase family protein [Streptomyces cocklensis]|uniref:Phytanoyl-CoA dioxygenase n=1 Tax=Actinacidiphila cocklensis TaxID=887465 RepID=A0A9W4DTP6_9ACTN|nr:phytanoyl-CoA dioxygenase family protein [Actinacidiphila cocklensis]MDD1059914.1 phytanoyl-CoA dioxygenase family protein [Actinacidiphila cocklensis]WSX72775.1 phytanoyl-CoA dioxygenase family protein [Streptomyces sp. NBC_00899]WSX81157.1 phytanoyl-CoA dioxygenase family protein [Streptomyces sp. NBC_00899]CAG6395863.1 Phytanoyl-CoA dioxygenase [Actinacidiphila cocklensis]
MDDNRRILLSSVQMARFAARGSLRLDAVVPAAMNAEAMNVLAEGVPDIPYGTPLSDAYTEGSFPRRLLELPEVAGALRSLVGPEPEVDHHAVHIREPRGGEAQALHADAIIDVRTYAFDVQLMYYPQNVTLDMGGTLSVPGSHLRRTNESDTGRYQNLRGQDRLVCPAGTVVFLHHGIWHGGRRNDGDETRYMFKIRFNPTVRQRLLWDTSDLRDPQVAAELGAMFPWYEQATGRLEVYNRVLLWRALTGDDDFDLDHWVTRVANRPQEAAV